MFNQNEIPLTKNFYDQVENIHESNNSVAVLHLREYNRHKFQLEYVGR